MGIVKIMNEETPSPWWAILGSLIPIVGIILYALWRKDKPLRANYLLIGTLVSIGMLFAFLR